MKRYWKYIRPYIQYYILGPCFMMMEVVGDVLLPYMLAKIINQGIAERNVAYIIKIGAIMGLIAVIMAVGGVLGAWFASKAAMNFGADLRMDLFEKIQQFSFQNIDNFSTGSLITRLTNDITQIQNMIMMTLRMCLRSPGILSDGDGICHQPEAGGDIHYRPAGAGSPYCSHHAACISAV